jgi:3-oxoacyl-[acyl-carrier protein] reductase
MLSGHSVLVTGAGQGVGRGIALAAGAAGAAVLVTARKPEAAEAVAGEIRGRGGRARGVGCDVTRRADIEAAVAVAVSEFGGLNAFVHNATSSYSSCPTPLEDLTEPDWDDQTAVALRALYYGAQAALPHLTARKGSLLVLSSTGAMEGSLWLPAYSAVKGAQRGLMKSLAREWGPLGVRVNALLPVALTPAMEKYFAAEPSMEGFLNARAALRRIGDIEQDIGAAARFLIGPDSAFVTGQTLVVNGGAYMP